MIDRLLERANLSKERYAASPFETEIHDTSMPDRRHECATDFRLSTVLQGGSSRRLIQFRGGVLIGGCVLYLLAAGPAAATAFDIGNTTLDFSDAFFGAVARTTDFFSGDVISIDERGTVPFVAPDVVEPGGRVAALRDASQFGFQFPDPVNPALRVFAAADITGETASNVGVSGMLGTPGTLLAETDYNYQVKNLGPRAQSFTIEYGIPEIEVSLAGTEFQTGNAGQGGMDGDLQGASVLARLDYEIVNPDGTVSTAGNIYNFSAQIQKRTPTIPGDPFGFSFDTSDDLAAIISVFTTNGVDVLPFVRENFFGEFDIATLKIPAFEGFGALPTVLVDQTLSFNFFAQARLVVPPVASENGGQARIGDPFSLAPSGGFALRFVNDPPVASIPQPATLLLFTVGLVGLAGGRATWGRSVLRLLFGLR